MIASFQFIYLLVEVIIANRRQAFIVHCHQHESHGKHSSALFAIGLSENSDTN